MVASTARGLLRTLGLWTWGHVPRLVSMAAGVLQTYAPSMCSVNPQSH